MFWSPFSQARFIPIGSIGYSMCGDGIKQSLKEAHAESRVMLAQDGNHRLKGFERLDSALETDRSWCNILFDCGLSDDRTDEIVGQDVRPDFLPDQVRSFAA